MAVVGNYAYVADGDGGLQVIGIRDRANPRPLASVGNHKPFGVAVAGNYAYVAEGYSGLEVIDLVNEAKDKFRFVVTGEAGRKVRVQRSRNLTDWQDWQEVTLGSGPADLTDADVLSVPCRFYRAVAP
jgi:hypothetical protein